MHQTTVRFSADLWADLEREAERSGVSAAQYVRDATLARIAYSAGMRGEPGPGAGAHTRAMLESTGHRQQSEAVWAQATLARERAKQLRAEAVGARDRHRGMSP